MTRDNGSTLWSTVRTSNTGRANRDTSDPAERQRSEEPRFESLTHEQKVDQIMSMNPSASTGFLDQFDANELGMYLRHLLSAQEPRGPLARWARPNDAPAIMTARRRY